MKVLALDTSNKRGVIALIDEEAVLFETKLPDVLTNTEVLLPHLEKSLKNLDIDLDAIDGLAVGLGPGSFTGLRLGLSTMKAFAQACHKPLVGVSSLLALAHNAVLSQKPVAALIDAKRGEVYVSVYQFKKGQLEKILLPETVMTPQNFVSEIQKIGSSLFIGDGALVYKEFFKEALEREFFLTPNTLISLQARWVAHLGLAALKSGEGKNWEALTPNYVRLSDAEKMLSRS